MARSQMGRNNPRQQAGSWKGRVAAGIRTGAHMGSRGCKARTFNHLRHRAGPGILVLCGCSPCLIASPWAPCTFDKK